MAKCSKCNRHFIGKKTCVCPKCRNLDLKTANHSIEGGISAMNENNFSEGVYRWSHYVHNSGPPQFEDYVKMLNSMKNCVFNHLSDEKYYSRDGLARLSFEMGLYDIHGDFRKELISFLPMIKNTSEIRRLASEYMFVYIDGFSVNINIDHMLDSSIMAENDLQKIISVMNSRKGSIQGKEEIAAYADFTRFIIGKLKERLESCTCDELAMASEYWHGKMSNDYGNMFLQTAEIYFRNKIKGGKSPLKNKYIDRKFDTFIDYYFSPRKKGIRRGF